MLRITLFMAAAFMLVSCGSKTAKESRSTQDESQPNIIFIYVDDLGYGDVGCYGAKGVETPNIDKMAENGVRFTDAHCSAATCTPSRFSLLTGKYAFRNKAAVLAGDAPALIRDDSPTIASMLQRQGYKTGVVGKWHLGLGDGHVDWNKAIKPGPLEIGFHYCFLIPATGDRVPCVYMENHHVVGLDPNDPIEVNYKKPFGDEPTGMSHPSMLRQLADPQHSCSIIEEVSRIGYMTGGKKALWKDEEFPDILTEKAKDFINDNKDNPFFLYFSFHDIHVPRIPNPRFVGKSTMGPRGDAIAQMDWCTGEIIKTLEALNLDKKTLIIFSSDNGPVLNDGYEDQSIELLGNHKPAGPFRGGKYSAYEAGTRVPTISYWPGTIEPGVSHAMLNQVDLFASIAELTNASLSEKEAIDSYPMFDAWTGKSNAGRKTMIEEAYVLSLRDKEWKFIPGGKAEPAWIKGKGIESGMSTQDQLYNLNDDPGEQHNLAGERLKIVNELRQKLDDIIKNGSKP